MRNIMQGKRRWPTRRLATVALLLTTSATLVPGCSGSGGLLPLVAALRANLSGFQEVQVPAVSTTATGTSTVTVNAQRTSLHVTLTTQGFNTAVVGAHIHAGAIGQNGGIIFDLQPAPGEAPGTLERDLVAANFRPAPAQNVTTFDQAVNAILNGNAYVNVHTTAFPGGEIRGQLVAGVITFRANLTGAQEAPTPTNSTATGSGQVELDLATNQLRIRLTSQGFASTVTGAHIHVGAPGEAGGIMFDLQPVAGEVPGTLSRTLTAADFRAVPAKNVHTFNDAIGAILRGQSYFNVHTTDFAAGEIRGQITHP